jgi:acetyl-CoA acetyltransferase
LSWDTRSPRPGTLLALLLELRRRRGSLVLVTACIGGGQGIATIVEAA